MTDEAKFARIIALTTKERRLAYAVQRAWLDRLEGSGSFRERERRRIDAATWFYDRVGIVNAAIFQGLYDASGLPQTVVYVPGFYTPAAWSLFLDTIEKFKHGKARGGYPLTWSAVRVRHPHPEEYVKSAESYGMLDGRVATIDPRLPLEERRRRAVGDERAFLDREADAMLLASASPDDVQRLWAAYEREDAEVRRRFSRRQIEERMAELGAARRAAEVAASDAKKDRDFQAAIGGATVLYRRGGYGPGLDGHTTHWNQAYVWPASREKHAKFVGLPDDSPAKLVGVADPPPVPVMEFLNANGHKYKGLGRKDGAWVAVASYSGTPHVVFDADGSKMPHSKRRNDILKAAGLK